MATLRAVKKRIKSASNIRQITKAMKMVSAAKLRKAQEKILAARPYAIKIEEVISDLISRADKQKYKILAENTGVTKEAIVLVSADKGLCGSFNMNLVKEAVKHFQANKDINFFMIGKKGLDLMKRFGRETDMFKLNDNRIGWEEVEEICGVLIKNYLEKKYSKVWVIYSEFKTSLQQKIIKKQILPVMFDPVKGETAPVDREFLYEPGEAEVLADLLKRYMKTQVYRGILESQASEQGVRMVAMEMATNNAADMIESLTLLANKTRQAQITKEILEIVSGAEALK